mmetsp:Transcript_29082/g.92758  ORF Transcript_29082/g.92758 Transcript_29082/m.92758 type:complete len:434 (-) Transcript_29082:328-1629(-)
MAAITLLLLLLLLAVTLAAPVTVFRLLTIAASVTVFLLAAAAVLAAVAGLLLLAVAVAAAAALLVPAAVLLPLLAVAAAVLLLAVPLAAAVAVLVLLAAAAVPVLLLLLAVAAAVLLPFSAAVLLLVPRPVLLAIPVAAALLILLLPVAALASVPVLRPRPVLGLGLLLARARGRRAGPAGRPPRLLRVLPPARVGRVGRRVARLGFLARRLAGRRLGRGAGSLLAVGRLRTPPQALRRRGLDEPLRHRREGVDGELAHVPGRGGRAARRVDDDVVVLAHLAPALVGVIEDTVLHGRPCLARDQQQPRALKAAVRGVKVPPQLADDRILAVDLLRLHDRPAAGTRQQALAMRQAGDAHPVAAAEEPEAPVALGATWPGVNALELQDGHLAGADALPALHLGLAAVVEQGLYSHVLALVAPARVQGDTALARAP